MKTESIVEGIGTFTAYNDSTMRAMFDDRTVVWIRGSIISILTRNGDNITLDRHTGNQYEKYTNISEEFYDWAFLPEEQKMEVATEAVEI